MSAKRGEQPKFELDRVGNGKVIIPSEVIDILARYCTKKRKKKHEKDSRKTN